MAGIAVVTDSTSCLPPEMIDGLGIKVVSTYYDLGDGPKRETDLEEDYGPYYEALAASTGLSTTSAPTVDDFRAVYEPLLETSEGVVSIHVSSALSDTCATARRVADQLDGARIAVLDSAGAAGMLGIQALAAARAAGAGQGMQEVVERIRRVRQEVRMWGLVDTLEYFRRGGRISSVATWMGSALDIKPILTIEHEIKAVERVRTRKRGIERLTELMRQRRSLGADRWFLNHAHALEEAQPLVDRLHEIFGGPPEFLWELAPVLGTHAGPGSLWVGSVTGAALR